MPKKEETPRSLFLFEESFRSEKTKELYVYYLNRFLIWAHKDHESLLVLSSSELDILLQDYLIYLKKRMNPNSLKPLFASIDKFLVLNDKTYNKRKLKMLFPETLKLGNERAFTTAEIKRILDYSDSTRNKAILHMLAATGCRIGALVDFQMKHISKMPDGCMAFRFYAGSKWEYFSFAHREAVKALKEYHNTRQKEGELLTEESYVFRPLRFFEKAKNKNQITEKAIASQNSYLIKKAGIKRIKTGKRYDVAIDMGFRKRFNTILKSNPNISFAIAERLMDHRTNLESHYLDTPKDKLFIEYKKAIPELIISDEERQKVELKRKSERISELEIQKDDIKELQAAVKRLDDMNKNRQKKIDELEKPTKE